MSDVSLQVGLRDFKGFACPWGLLHISALIKNDYPVATLLLLVSFPLIGLIFLIAGLLAKNKHSLGIINGFTLYWRGNIGFGGGWLLGLTLAVVSYELNLIKF